MNRIIENSNRLNQAELTLLNRNNIWQVKDTKSVTLRQMIDIYNLKSDYEFKSALFKIGYHKALNYNFKWARNLILGSDWEELLKHPFLIAFFLKDIYSEKYAQIDNLIYISRSSRDELRKTDFVQIDHMPDSIFTKIKERGIKGKRRSIYSLKKDLFQGLIFANYCDKTRGTELANLNIHSGYMALDIDMPIDNEREVLKKIHKHFKIFTVLNSPSLVIRPILKIEISDDNLKEFAKWRNMFHGDDAFPFDRARIMKGYHEMIFKKITTILGNEKVMSNGVATPLKFDPVCKNANKLWYIARNPSREIKINENAKAVGLTYKECLKYKERGDFSFMKDIFAGITNT